MRLSPGVGITGGPARRYLAIPGVLHRPDGRRERVEPAQASAQAGSVSAARRANRLVGRSREPGQPRPQERFRRWFTGPVSRGRKRGADGGLRLGKNCVCCVAHLGDDLRGGRHVGFASGHQPQPKQVRMAARLVIAYLVGERHRKSPTLPAQGFSFHCGRTPAGQGPRSCGLPAQPAARPRSFTRRLAHASPAQAELAVQVWKAGVRPCG